MEDSLERPDHRQSEKRGAVTVEQQVAVVELETVVNHPAGASAGWRFRLRRGAESAPYLFSKVTMGKAAGPFATFFKGQDR